MLYGKATQMKEKIKLLYPLLFVIHPILFLYSNNIGQVPAASIIKALFFSLLSAIFIYIILSFFLRDNTKASISLTAILIVFFSYGHVYTAIEGASLLGFTFGRHRYLAPASFVILVIILLSIARTHLKLIHLKNLLQWVGTFLCLSVIFTISVNAFRMSKVQAPVTEEQAPEIQRTIISKEDTPDIYYIILDGYPRNSTLKEIFNFDNGSFLDDLKKKGFFIGEKSRSNYAESFLSLSSSLNMRYINGITDPSVSMDTFSKTAFEMIENNKVKDFLKSRGYIFINIGPGYAMTNTNKYADINLLYKGFNEFERSLIKTTALVLFESFFMGNDLRKHFFYSLKSIEKTIRMPGHKFVFAHIISPHPPFIFTRNGAPVQHLTFRENGRLSWHPKKQFVGQLIFLNKKIEGVIDTIIKASKISPVIIIQADHGSASTFINGWDNPTPQMLSERMDILNAYYLPNVKEGVLYDTVSPVNTFRIIFDQYFNTKMGLLKDTSYYSTYEAPFKFKEYK